VLFLARQSTPVGRFGRILIGLGLIFVFLYPLYGSRLARVKRLCSAGRDGEPSKAPVPEPEVLTS